MNCIKKSLNLPIRCINSSAINFFKPSCSNQSDVSNEAVKSNTENAELNLQISKAQDNTPCLHRNLQFLNKYVKPREVWVENFDTVREQKRGLIELHPKIFGTIPRLDIIYSNVRWQNLYNKVILYSAKTKAEMKGGGRKPHPQKGTGRARQGSIRSPHLKGGGVCHGPRNPTSYFYVLPHHLRVHGLTSTLSAKLAQDDLHVIDNINIPTEDSQFILDLIKKRHWGSSVLIVDTEDIMPRNITVATDDIGYVNLMPVYGLNVYSMLKHETLVLTVAAVEEIEKKLLEVMHCGNPLQFTKEYDFKITK